MAAASMLLGLPADAAVEDIEYVLGDMVETLERIDSKRGVLQDQIAVASRGKRRRRASQRLPPPAAPALLPPLPGPGDDAVYTRKGAAGALRRRLRNAAGDAKKEQERLQAVCGDLEEALVDAKELMALQRGGTA
ncbi:hypothetical protein QOZ80_6BG0469990 [Eleusine coracana subsp. coracana]|nr:hypothetical protein QOZ80_6BG0469990 [Eleusine coracana subsp. coracana]